jgi:hypothetical protein
MKLCECNLGQIVVEKGNKRRIGHVIGLAYNYDRPESWKEESTEIIPIIKWVGEQIGVKIHYANIDIFKAY